MQSLHEQATNAQDGGDSTTGVDAVETVSKIQDSDQHVKSMDTLLDADADMAQDDEEETAQQVAQDPKTGQPLHCRLVSTEDTEVDGEGYHWD
eukprot:1267746-Rhodomonas_salina.1